MTRIPSILASTRHAVHDASFTISRFGERCGVDALVYNPGIMVHFDYWAVRNAPGFAARLLATFGFARYLDVGAGTGRFAQALHAAGASAEACEHSRWGRMLAARRGVRVAPFDLTTQRPGPAGGYEVAFSLEVAEHLPAALGDRLVAYLSSFPFVVITAAHPGQGGTGHINEQPKAYWEQRFARHDKRRDLAAERRFLDSPGAVPGNWLLENLMIFA